MIRKQAVACWWPCAADAKRLLADLTGAGIIAASVGRIDADGAHQIRVQD